MPFQMLTVALKSVLPVKPALLFKFFAGIGSANSLPILFSQIRSVLAVSSRPSFSVTHFSLYLAGAPFPLFCGCMSSQSLLSLGKRRDR